MFFYLRVMIFLLFAIPFAFTQVDEGGRSFQRRDQEELIDFFLTVGSEHPEFFASGGFYFDPLKLLEGEDLPETITLPSFQNLYVISLNQEETQLNLDDLNKLKQRILENLKILRNFAWKNLAEDFHSLPKDPKQIQAWLWLSAWMYHPVDGHLKLKIVRLTSIIKRADAFTIRNIYQDIFPHHIQGLIKKHLSAKNAFKSAQLNRFSNHLQKATHIRENFLRGEVPTQRIIALKKESKWTSLYRSMWGVDCSSASVPYFSLAENTKVFSVRKNGHPQGEVLGYVFVVEVLYQGKKVPYILTINTKNQAKTVRTLVQAVGKIYQSAVIILPDFSRNPALVNIDEMKQGMSFKESKQVRVSFGKDWRKWDKYTQKHHSQYKNYYFTDQISTARLIQRPDFEIKIEHRKVGSYDGLFQIERIDPLSRALLAHRFERHFKAKSNHLALLKRLDIKEELFHHAAPLHRFIQEFSSVGVDAYRISLEAYKVLHQKFDFYPKKFLRYMGVFPAALLTLQLYRYKKKLGMKIFEGIKEHLAKRLRSDLENPLLVLSYGDRLSYSVLLDSIRYLMFKKYKQNIDNLDQKTRESIRLSLPTEIVKFYVKKGANIQIQANGALRTAASEGRLDVVEFLLDEGANIHAIKDSTLIEAVSRGHLETVALLIDRGANIHAQDNQALIIAASRGYLGIVALLIDRGSFEQKQNGKVLKEAKRQGHLEIVKLLENKNKESTKASCKQLRMGSW